MLLDGSVRARAVPGYACAYWGVRLIIQFGFFERHAPPGPWFKIAEGLLTLLFFGWTEIYELVVSEGFQMAALEAAYLPASIETVMAAAALLTMIFVNGFVLARLNVGFGRLIGLGALPFALAAADSVTRTEPAVSRMLVIVASVVYVIKGVGHVEGPRLTLVRWSIFCPGSFGMKPSCFHGERRPDAE